MKIQDLSWHDGILHGYNFRPNYDSISTVELDLELYPEQILSSERNIKIKLLCKNVSHHSINCDVSELFTNKNAGNINSGELAEQYLRLELFGGLIEIKAESYEIKTS